MYFYASYSHLHIIFSHCQEYLEIKSEKGSVRKIAQRTKVKAWHAEILGSIPSMHSSLGTCLQPWRFLALQRAPPLYTHTIYTQSQKKRENESNLIRTQTLQKVQVSNNITLFVSWGKGQRTPIQYTGAIHVSLFRSQAW